MNKEKVQTLMLAGGIGKRLSEITGSLIPKSFVELAPNYKAIDYILEQLDKVGLTATWSADHYYYQYQDHLQETNHQMLWQKPGGIVEAILQPKNTVLAIAPDCIFPFRDLPQMISQHQPGTITWAVTKHPHPNMDSYRGMDVTENGAIIGREDQSIIRAPITIIDNNLLKIFTNSPPTEGEGEDLYFDVLLRIEKENLKRIKKGQKSILNAFFLSGPVIDYGTPTRLLELRKNFRKVENDTNN